MALSFHRFPAAQFHLQEGELHYTTGRYMRHPCHWGQVDRWFDPWTDEKPQPVKPKSDPAPDYRSLAELGQQPGDIDIPKHRWSAFHGTALDLTLRVQSIGTVMIIGGSTHVGVASTVYAGRDLDYQMIVVKDACTGHKEQRDYFCDYIFPRMVRVRTVDEIAAMIGS